MAESLQVGDGERMRSEPAPILIAVGDALLHPEATHIAAATGRPIIDAHGRDDVTRHYTRAFAVFIDEAFLAEVPGATDGLPPREGVFFVATDASGVADSAHALENTLESTELSAFAHTKIGCSGSFVLPAQAADLLRAIGRLALRAQSVAAATVGGGILTAATAVRPAHVGSGVGGGRVGTVGTVLCFVGAAGGAGTSTLAAAVARTAAVELAPVLVDAQRYSGGLDLLLGIEDEVGARWGDLDIGEGAVDRDHVRRALPRTADGIAALTSARTTVAHASAPTADEIDRVTAALGAGGLTIVDATAGHMPNRCDHTFIVAPAEVRAAASAALIAAECRAANMPASVVLRHRGWSGLSAAEMENISKTEVVAELKHIPRLVKSSELSGLPQRLPRPLASVAETVLKVAA